ncbi:MAG: hypothetical protein V3T61_12015, partial [Acidobacteriota bacterium]
MKHKRAGHQRSWPYLTLYAVLFLGLSAANSAHGTTLVKPQGEDRPRPRSSVDAHDSTHFPLIGRHRTVECMECH